MYTQYFKYIWKKRRYVHVEWIFCFRKGNKRSINKIEKRILPSQVQRIEKTREVQKVLQTLCDKEDDDSPEKSFVFARNRRTNHNINFIQQKKILEVDITDLSSDSSCANENSILFKKKRQSKSERDQKAKSVQDSYSTQKVSRSVVKEKTSKKYKISSDSNDNSTDTSLNKTGKRTIKSEKIVKRKINIRICSSDSESDENDINRASNVSKRTSKDIKLNKKMDNSYDAKSKTKKYDSINESEDEEHKKQNRRKHLETSRMTSHSNNDEQKCDKSSKQKLSNIQEDDSDDSSSKEFQKIKLQKVNRDKYSVRQLVDSEINHTKSPIKNLNDKSDKDINEQSNQNLNDVKNILKDCKKICLNFQMYVESIEQLYDKEDEEQLILKSTEKIGKLRTMLEKKQKDLTTSYQLFKNKKKSATRRSNKVVNDNKSSEEREKFTESENRHISIDEQDENKAVSECDSEEIFSADETRSPQKMQATLRKVDTARIENSLSNNETNTDDEDKISIAESKNNDKGNVSMQDDLITSPILGLKEKKTSTERSSKKQLFLEYNKSNNEIQLTNENANDKQKSNLSIDNDETKIENSLSKSSNKKVTLENDETNQSNKKNIINESMDMFDTSPETAEESRMEVEINVETNCDKEALLHTSKDKFLDPCESFLQDKVPSEKEKISLSIYDNKEEKDVANQDNQKKTNAEVPEDLKVSGKTNVDDNESLDDAEALAKKTLLATDSDTSDTPDENVAKLTEDLTTNDTNRNEKKNETEGNDSDVNSVSTIILSTFIKETNTDAEKNIITKAETKAEKKSDDRSDKRSRQKVSSSEDEEAEKAAKKALLESNSDDSVFLSSESGKFTDKKSESDSYGKNAEAKLSLLASSSETSSSEPTLSEMANVSKNIKHNHESEPENDGESMISRLKKRRLKLDKNHHYKNDKKLRMSCKVHLTRLSTEVLKCYSRALRKSTEYLEHKALKRYQILSVKHMSIVLHRLAYK